ncbi:hypothetical protein [Lysobacter niastensis]|uniref:Lipoprotein n=1 Tax=Lysobacter niastensis TaxID=380629 RepID=A0ABS0B3G0_9GAMM|nr:hypothetical protein [Lysobacter niastensis]MBF6023017.1 hypothetical protein [Lysobacter niastensis]
MTRARIGWVVCGITAAMLLPGCEKPEKERRPEPQATELRDAIQAPIQKAKQVDTDVQEAADQQREAIEAQGG